MSIRFTTRKRDMEKQGRQMITSSDINDGNNIPVKDSSATREVVELPDLTVKLGKKIPTGRAGFGPQPRFATTRYMGDKKIKSSKTNPLKKLGSFLKKNRNKSVERSVMRGKSAYKKK